MSDTTEKMPVYGYESPMQQREGDAEEGEEKRWSFSVSFGRHADLDIEIDAEGMNKAEILGAVADTLLEGEDRKDFGMNLDALYDVLTDLKKGDEVQICFNHWFDSRLTAEEREMFEAVAFDAAEEVEDAELRVLFVHRDYRSRACG